jgi:hypothetical protein
VAGCRFGLHGPPQQTGAVPVSSEGHHWPRH